MVVTSSFSTILFCSIGVFLIMLVWIAGCSAQGRNEGESCQATPNVMGTCRMIAECEEAKVLVKKGGRPALCGYKGIQPIVCCTQNDGNGPSAKIKEPIGDKALRHCYEYKQLCPGRPLYAVGGEPAETDEFPHMAAIGYGVDKDVVWGCGGALISENYVLTAAHCLRDARRGPANLVRLGAEVIEDTIRGSSLNAAKGQTHRVLERIKHPGYKRPEKYNDVALLKIDGSPIEGNRADNRLSWTIRPACLHAEGDFELKNGKAIATGWGRVGFGEEVSPVLQKVSLSVLDNSLCNNSFDVEIRTTSQLPRGIDSSLICAGELGGGIDTCLGDSGGPLQLTNHGGTCVIQLIGITSFGKICGFKNSPGVYMKVKHFVPWIESIVWPE